MFVVCFGDGLGNQMFQYAFYCSLQENYPHNNVSMDLFNIYGGHIHNGFELNRVFKIQTNECDKKDAIKLADYWPKQFKRYWLLNRLAAVRRYFVGVKESYITQDDPTEYYEEVYHLSTLKSYILKGNWANEKYLMRVEKRLYKDFVFPELDKSNMQIANKMRTTNSVAVHVRLGDYLSTSMINLNEEYYLHAKQRLESLIQNPKYFIFSDEIDKIKRIKEIFPNAELVQGNKKENSYRDMQLMTMCKHNIIANSTFSFWGAYLNKNDQKIVVAPSKAAKHMNNPFACEDWLLVEV